MPVILSRFSAELGKLGEIGCTLIGGAALMRLIPPRWPTFSSKISSISLNLSGGDDYTKFPNPFLFHNESTSPYKDSITVFTHTIIPILIPNLTTITPIIKLPPFPTQMSPNTILGHLGRLILTNSKLGQSQNPSPESPWSSIQFRSSPAKLQQKGSAFLA